MNKKRKSRQGRFWVVLGTLSIAGLLSASTWYALRSIRSARCHEAGLVLLAGSVCMKDKESRCFVTPDHLLKMRKANDFIKESCRE